MKHGTSGRDPVVSRIENLGDLFMDSRGLLPFDQFRLPDFSDAPVAPGATSLSMPGAPIKRLNLLPLRSRTALTSAGLATFKVFGATRLTVQGRDCTIDVTEVPDDCPVLIGQAPLELLDFEEYPKNRCLIGNPEHGGEQMLEMH